MWEEYEFCPGLSAGGFYSTQFTEESHAPRQFIIKEYEGRVYYN